ncbi:transmembrane channel 5 [Solea senegalensis]|uniref:Transmembrane channel-like protein n=1 Tax=Solea senegalensis TaxID=28829 RepID=A0AAV6QA94_SOLSE|nr:transmembrane channel-like protein 5 isoform X1 [Solea senegalensis]KAG7487022.1 transmembrane channel 5 [Solea senegalensis]
MTSYSNGGFFNPAYHDNETLEIDKRYPRKNNHTNPYAREAPSWQGSGAETHNGSVGRTTGGDDSLARMPWGGWEEESQRGRESIPMGLISTRHHDRNHSAFQINPDSQYDRSRIGQLPSSISANMTMRWRGMTMRSMSMFPDADPARLAFTEDAIRNEMENEEQNQVKELVALSTRDRIHAIRSLPTSFAEKKHIRSQVLKSAKKSRKNAHLADFSENVSLFFRRCGYSVRSARQTLQLWHGIMKEIGGKFGTSVLSYFVFLKWLLMFNIFSFLVNFGFITIPLLVYDPTPNIPPNVSFRGLELLTGAGYFRYTVMYYGGYSNKILVGLVDYNMQLAYFFTITLYMVLCGVALLYSMASSFQTNYVLAAPASSGAWQLLCSWDFSVTNERAVRQRKNNLRVQLQESLSEKAQRERLTLSVKLKQFGVYLGSWLLSTGLAVGCGASIFYLCQYEEQRTTDAPSWTLLQEAETLLLPFVVSLMNLVIPLFYSLFNKFELYSSQRKQVYALVVRNVLLRGSILGVLCYYWMNVVPEKFSCWESVVGQSLYRLVIFDFLFLMLGSFFGEFLSKVLGTTLLPRLGVPEFDIARNVLELIYAQTLAWIGIYFSPLLPAIQILKFFILFYLKKVSLTHNCQPPRRTGRAAQMQTTFIALLFFPFFVGAVSMVAFTAWRLTPSKHCGPFRGLSNTFIVVEVWIAELAAKPGSVWVVWIYQHVIESELFYFMLVLIVLVVIYMFWQVIQGRKQLIVLLKQQIVNEGKDKAFLLEKLQNLQKSRPNKILKQKTPKKHTKQRSGNVSAGGQSTSNAMLQALFARQQLEDEEGRRGNGGVPVPSDISTSSALVQAMMARQRAEDQEEDTHMSDTDFSSPSAFTQASQARQRAEVEAWDEHNGAADYHENAANTSSAVMLVMQARQRAEDEDRTQWVPAHPQNPVPAGSSALIQAMLARQQAQNEFDDGY